MERRLCTADRRNIGPEHPCHSHDFDALHQYFGQFWLRGSRTSPYLLKLYLPMQPRREGLHATAPQCIAASQPKQETAA